ASGATPMHRPLRPDQHEHPTNHPEPVSTSQARSKPLNLRAADHPCPENPSINANRNPMTISYFVVDPG
ncbi:MAG: hypothetical protein KJO75_14150, partial [Dactylosporangium sp.]|nr:hypothetical protein [Dactylosporangium sp.]